MSEPYLIVHVVRSEPAFDIAIRCDDMGTESDPAPWWIIPTSGHRAYPYWYRELKPLSSLFIANYGHLPLCPPDWPDHYSTLPAPRGQGLLSNLAEALGFAPKPIKIRRR